MTRLCDAREAKKTDFDWCDMCGFGPCKNERKSDEKVENAPAPGVKAGAHAETEGAVDHDAQGQGQKGLLIEGCKDDGGKAPWHLLPFDATTEVVGVLKFGADKYGERNWEHGMDWGRLFSAAIRHLAAWQNGETRDPETGLSHLAHAACCVLFLLTYEIRVIGRDTRPIKKGAQ